VTFGAGRILWQRQGGQCAPRASRHHVQISDHVARGVPGDKVGQDVRVSQNADNIGLALNAEMNPSAAQWLETALGELADGRPAAAMAPLKQALALDWSLVSAHYHLGVALVELGRLEEAQAAYRDATLVDATYTAAHQNLGELLAEQGKLEQACVCFERVLRTGDVAEPADVAHQPIVAHQPNAAHHPGVAHHADVAHHPDVAQRDVAAQRGRVAQRARVGLADALVKLNDFAAATALYREAIPGSRAPADLYLKLGAALWKLGDSAAALEAFEQAVSGLSGSAEAHYNLGSAQLELGRFEEALRSAREALSLRPAFTEALVLCAAAAAARGSLDEAIRLLTRGTVAPPQQDTSGAQRYLMLATRLMASKLFAPARNCLEQAVQADPTDVMARHLLDALSGQNPAHPTEGYVRQLFDTSAATFDRDVVSKLGYGIPGEIVKALLAAQGGLKPPWEVLDLGCGTGLVGVEISSHSRRLAGVDLAPNMIDRARERGVYTELYCADLMEALAYENSRETHYDVVTAADVFIYVGQLDDVIPAIRRVLRPDGLFAFSAEASEVVEAIEVGGGGEAAVAGEVGEAGVGTEAPAPQIYRLGRMGRYAHSAAYLRRLASLNGFDIELLRETRIRLEHRRPVQGWLTVWRARSG
jgi:predicted TPR repeat methyltransferase